MKRILTLNSFLFLLLAVAAGCAVTAHHVDHGLRPEGTAAAALVATHAERFGAAFVRHRVKLDPGSNLEARARKKWGNDARVNMLQVAAFLMDYGRAGCDLRYLNAVLKLADRKWLIDQGHLEQDLKRQDEVFVGALFQCSLRRRS